MVHLVLERKQKQNPRIYPCIGRNVQDHVHRLNSRVEFEKKGATMHEFRDSLLNRPVEFIGKERSKFERR